MPNALVITTAGINCDAELARAFELAGARAQSLHMNELLADPSLIDRFDLIGIPGGFSYGDAVAAGRVAAHLMREALYPAFVRAIERGVPTIAPCNGFQIAAQMGLLPGPLPGARWPDAPPPQTITLARNATARFVDRWTRMEVPNNTRCIWTQGIVFDDDTGLLPIAHGEGRFIPADDDILNELESNGQIAIRYRENENFNGSTARIAGVCDATGLIFGLMPHPERYTRWTQHPWWTRLEQSIMQGDPPGLRMFRNAVTHAVNAATVRS